MAKKKKKIDLYFVYGYVHEHLDIEFPCFQFSTRSLKLLCEFVTSVDYELIDIQIVRYFEDGTTNFVNVEALKELAYEIQ